MKRLARSADGRLPEAPVTAVPPGVGIFRAATSLRRLLRSGAQGAARKEAPGAERLEEDAGAHRSVMEAGITGGISLLPGVTTVVRRPR